MSVDTVNEALTKVRLWVIEHGDMWGPEGKQNLLSVCEVMRSHLMQEDIEGFIDATQRMLGTNDGATGEILEQLFGLLLGDEQAMWEQFEEVLRAL